MRQHEDGPQLGLGASVPTGALFWGPGPFLACPCAKVKVTLLSGLGECTGLPEGSPRPHPGAPMPATQMTPGPLKAAISCPNYTAYK